MDAIDLGATAIQLVKIPSGRFLMGSPNVLFSEAPLHEVTIGYEFYLGKYLVTQHQWEIIMGKNNSAQFQISPEDPVDSISWEEAIAFCQKISKQCGARVRLPLEAEWEYACRAGTEGEFCFTTAGPFIDETSVPFEVRAILQEYAWFEENRREETHAVGIKKPNPWGLFDIIDNLWKWCEDVWHSDYVGAPIDGSPWCSDADRQPRCCLRDGAGTWMRSVVDHPTEAGTGRTRPQIVSGSELRSRPMCESNDVGSGRAFPHVCDLLLHMVRPLRLGFPSMQYHVTSRSNQHAAQWG